MLFTNSSILWALLAILIPIAIHLFHFRKFKKTYFSNVALLENIRKQSQNQSKLKHLLILCCRILTIIFIVLAFAQPHPKTALKPLVGEGINYVSIAIDNSFSMAAHTDQGTLLEQAKEKAENLLLKFKASDRFTLVTQDFFNDNQRFVSREEVLDAIEQLDIVPFSHRLSELATRQKNMFKHISDNSKSLFLLSDFQKTMVDFENLNPDTILQTWMYPVQSQIQSNISIDSVSIEAPIFQVGNEIEFKIQLTNYSEQTLQDIPVKLFINKELISVGNVGFEPRQTQTISRKLTLQNAGYLQGYFEISDYPITFDDRLYFTLNILEKIPILLLTESTPNTFLKKLLGQNPSFEFNVQNIQNLDYSMLNNVNFVILDEIQTLSSGLQNELHTAIEAGVSVLVLPGEQSNLNSINSLIKQVLNTDYESIDISNLKVDAILSGHPIYRSAFVKLPENLLLPEVQKHFPIRMATRSNIRYLLRLNNQEPFLAYGDFGKGRMYLSSVPFANEFSNFQNQPIFVVTILNMALQSIANEDIYHSLNQQEATLFNVAQTFVSEIFHLKSEDSDFELIPQLKFNGNQVFINTFSALKQAGNYVLKTQSESVAKLSYNFDRHESNPESYSQSELEHLLEQEDLKCFKVLGNDFISKDYNVLEVDMGTSWWKWCLVLALIFLLTEALILRFF